MSSVFFISLIYHEDILPSCPSSSSTSECVLVHDSSIVSVTPFCHYHEYTLPSCHSFSSTSECVLIHESLLILCLILFTIIDCPSLTRVTFQHLSLLLLSIGGEMLWFTHTTFRHIHISYIMSYNTPHIMSYSISYNISYITLLIRSVTCLSHVTFARCIHTRMIARRHLTVVCHVSHQSLLAQSITVVSQYGSVHPVALPMSACLLLRMYLWFILYSSLFFSFFVLSSFSYSLQRCSLLLTRVLSGA